MVIKEENTNPFGGESLADQLQNIAKEEPNPKAIQQAQTIEGIGNNSQQPKKKPKDLATINLLDDSNTAFVSNNKVSDGKYVVKKYNSKFILNVIGIVLLLALSFIAYLGYEYLNLKAQPIIPSDKAERVQKFSDTYDKYGQILGLFNKDQYLGLSLAKEGEQGATNILKQDNLNYVQKKDILQGSLNSLGNEIISLKTDIRAIKDNLNKDGFFPQELMDILKENNAVGSIQRSLLSLEVVKFSSAMKVFSLMDVFVSSLADNLGYSKGEIQAKLKEFIERGERDVEYYLNVCYNNPYEPTKCDKINDFDSYYKKIIGEITFETDFFKTLMEFIDNKLEYSNIPSFSIIFNSFDGKSNSVGFTVEVNTLKEDEYALIQEGIKSPHIFIVSELIKLLKQSTFIVGKAIDAKDIKVSPKQITIGGSKYIVNNSIKNFNLPIQKATEREIFDFLGEYSSTLQEDRGSVEYEETPLQQTTENNVNQEIGDENQLLFPSNEIEGSGAFVPVTLE